MALVAALPVDSAFARSYTGGVPWGWDQEMAAATVEMLHASIRVMLRAYGAKSSAVPKPLSVPRPWRATADVVASGSAVDRPRRPRRKATSEEVVSMLGPLLGGRR